MKEKAEREMKEKAEKLRQFIWRQAVSGPENPNDSVDCSWESLAYSPMAPQLRSFHGLGLHISKKRIRKENSH